MTVRTPWSTLGDAFLTEGDWAIGQGVHAPDRQLFRHLVRGVAEDLNLLDGPKRLAVLEVGCGPGIEVQGLEGDLDLRDQITYTGFDFTPELVDGCRQRFPKGSFDTRDVVTMNDQGIADVVYARHLLEHVTDGEQALRNLYAATRDILIVSWFIRPTWCDDEVGCVEADGFLHHTYSAHRWISLVRELGAYLYRFDLDHHLTRGSVWIISRYPWHDLAAAAHEFLASDAFLTSVLPVPPDRREREHDLLDILEEAHQGLGKVIPAVPKVTDMLLVLQEVRAELDRSITVLATHGEDDNAVDALRRARDTRERVKAALGEDDPDAEAAAQAARDAQARIASALIENGRLGG